MICQNCKLNRTKYDPQRPRPLEQQLLNSAKARAKKKKLPINITIDDIIIPEFCPILGIKLERGKERATPNSPSIDRFLPELGYVKGNISIISFRANTIKSNSNFEEVKALYKYMKNHKT